MAKINLSPPAAAAHLLSLLCGAGFASYFVGGCVRDSLLGLCPHDWDIATAALPDQVHRVFAGFPIADTGIAHGTVTVVADGAPYEITTFRTESAYSDGRHPDRVQFVSELAADLSRRDFTVNAMAWSPAFGLVDPFGGQADLAAGILRCVGSASARFAEDHLRILRALRFASVYGFQVDQQTAAAIHRQSGLLCQVAAERLFSEFRRLLCGKAAADVLAQFADAAFVLTPQLACEKGCAQPCIWHDKEVWEHTLAALAAAPPDEICRLAVYFHDCGKPASRTTDEWGQAHFYGHAAKSEALARLALTRLKAENAVKEEVCKLVRWHSTPPAAEKKAARRWLMRLGEPGYRRLLAVWRADVLAGSGYRLSERLFLLNAAEDALNEVLRGQDCFTLKQLAVSGSDLLALGVVPGPAVGRLLHRLLDAVIDGSLPNERTALCKAALRMINEDE